MVQMLLLIIWAWSCAIILSAPQGSKKFPFPFPPLLPDLPSFESATPVFTFDGIDYDDLPKWLQNRHSDCIAEYLSCVQNRNYVHIVCVYMWHTGRMGNFYSHCGMEYQNCVRRPTVHGTKYTNDYYFFNGEGHDCVHNKYKSETGN